MWIMDWVKMDLLINGKKTLVLGIGGGYDIYTSLPWFLSLSSEDQSLCILANYSFTDDLHLHEKYIVEVTPSTTQTNKNKYYFPERHLASCLNRSIYAIRLVPCPLLIDVLKSFIIEHEIEQIYMFDGGIDSIIYGGEHPYGSPLEDSQMVLACYKLNIPSRLFVSAFGIDECDNTAYLNNWSKCPGNTWVLGPKLSGWNKYCEIVRTSEPPSIIQECIVAAGKGFRGKYKNERLIPSRIQEEDDLPSILDNTDLIWEWDLSRLINDSLFYQHLLTKFSDINCTSLDTAWIDWDHIIVRYLQ